MGRLCGEGLREATLRARPNGLGPVPYPTVQRSEHCRTARGGGLAGGSHPPVCSRPRMVREVVMTTEGCPPLVDTSAPPYPPLPVPTLPELRSQLVP